MAPKQQPNPWRLMHLGTEFAAATLILGGLGWLVDQKAATSPWGLLTGFVVGAVGGFYLLVKEVYRMDR